MKYASIMIFALAGLAGCMEAPAPTATAETKTGAVQCDVVVLANTKKGMVLKGEVFKSEQPSRSELFRYEGKFDSNVEVRNCRAVG